MKKGYLAIWLLACLVLIGACKEKEDADSLGRPQQPATKEYRQNGLTLSFTNAGTINAAVKDKMIETFFAVYPQLTARFNPQAASLVYFRIDQGYAGVAYTTNNATIVFSADWMRNNPQDIDVVTHELMHVVQSYDNGLSWLTEGIADYARYKFGVNNAAAGWALPNFSDNQIYTDSYRVTARFLVWLENKVNPDIVNELDRSLRNKTYTNDTWVELTGKTVDELWQLYAQNPKL
ncbi:MAG: secretory protein [Cytophagales bacterium CG18_big_fil_WC_8_21_14_2_50_42_9]|nr:MAG: secretory protein [Cytophagales bacterium CG18_big_fil_WC_8_21_14_2_50_42_9]